LKSNVHLSLSDNTILRFSNNPDDYLPLVLTRWEGVEIYNYSPFIYAYHATNVAMTGNGIINGNAAKTFATWRPLQKVGQQQVRAMGTMGVVVSTSLFPRFARKTYRVYWHSRQAVAFSEKAIRNSLKKSEH
jgi:polygalacturonase